MINSNIEPPKALTLWEENGTEKEIFYKSMQYARTSTKESKILSTHYKIIHNIWPTKEKRFHWKLENNDLCHCNSRDTIIHTLCECEDTKIFLEKAFTYLDKENTYSHTLNYEHFIFGIEFPAWNLIFLVLKWYIVTRRVKGNTLNIQNFKHHLFQRIISEKQILSTYKFNEKWNGFEWLIEDSQSYCNWDN